MLLIFNLFWQGFFNSAVPLVPKVPVCAGLCCSGTCLAGILLFTGWQHAHMVVLVTPVLTHSHVQKTWQRPHKTWIKGSYSSPAFHWESHSSIRFMLSRKMLYVENYRTILVWAATHTQLTPVWWKVVDYTSSVTEQLVLIVSRLRQGEALSEIIFLCLLLLSALTPCLKQSWAEQELLWHLPGELYSIPVTTVITRDCAVLFSSHANADQNKVHKSCAGESILHLTPFCCQQLTWVQLRTISCTRPRSCDPFNTCWLNSTNFLFPFKGAAHAVINLQPPQPHAHASTHCHFQPWCHLFLVLWTKITALSSYPMEKHWIKT